MAVAGRCAAQYCWLILLPAVVAAATDPATVSPGAPDRAPAVGDRCPTFSWVAPFTAVSQEIVVFRADLESLEIDRGAPVLETEVAGGATTWTPALGECLEAGGVYAWSVRAHFEDGASAWAEARLFSLPSGPTEEDLEEALEVVRRHLAARAGTVGVAPASLPAPASPTSPPGGSFPFGETFYIAGDGTVVGNAFVYSCGVGAASPFWRDFDGDGFGAPNDPTTACAQPPGYVSNEGDCDDDNPALNVACICDPFDTSIVCGADNHCEPQPSGDPLCNAGVGAGGQNAACSGSADCQADYFCFQGTSCRRWCRVSLGGGDCGGDEVCSPFSTKRFIGATEWGTCDTVG